MSKDIKNKYQPHLIYTSLLEEVSKVRIYGIKKYGSSSDWLTTVNVCHFDAAIRHIRKHIDGEFFDNESKLLHLSHAISNLMFELERLYLYDCIPSQEQSNE